MSKEESLENALSFSKLLKDVWPNKYVKEIAGSYYTALHGHLLDNDHNVIKLFPMIDIRTCSELVRAFDSYFNKAFEQEMKSQKFYYEAEEDKRPTKEEIEASFKNGFTKALEIVKEGKVYDVAGTELFLYAELKERGVINLSQEQMKSEMDKALVAYKSKLNLERYDTKTNYGRRKDLAILIENIIPEDNRVINLAKRNILNEILTKIINKTIKFEI